MRFWFLLFLSLSALIGSLTAQPFVIRNVRVFDGARVLPATAVVIENGKIARIASQVAVTPLARVVEGAGHTLLPGFIDSHTHAISRDALRQALVFGVTTELDMFTSHQLAADIRKEQGSGRSLDLADLRSASTLVTAPTGHGTEYGLPIPTISEPAQAQAFVDARIAEGSDYIKIIYGTVKRFPTISKAVLEAVVAAAHARGKLAVAHIESLETASEAVAAGADGLVHLFVDRQPDPEFAALVGKRKVFVVPTLTVLGGVAAGPPLLSDSLLAWISTENNSPKREAGFAARATWSNAMIAHSTRAH